LLVERTVGKKAVLFLDGHGSHLSVDAIDFCMMNDIELICLPPRTSHRLQPLDTHFNKPLKCCWSSEVSKFLENNNKVVLTKYEFAVPFWKVWHEMSSKRGLLVDAFHHCGLFPLHNPTTKKDFQLSKVWLPEKESHSHSESSPAVVYPESSQNAAHLQSSHSISSENTESYSHKASRGGSLFTLVSH
jgi:hypothetical protein